MRVPKLLGKFDLSTVASTPLKSFNVQELFETFNLKATFRGWPIVSPYGVKVRMFSF